MWTSIIPPMQLEYSCTVPADFEVQGGVLIAHPTASYTFSIGDRSDAAAGHGIVSVSSRQALEMAAVCGRHCPAGITHQSVRSEKVGPLVAGPH